MARTYYMILGVARDETPRGIRAAYRDRARLVHPDRAGPKSTGAFQELSEAYEVLSDPERRRDYDIELRHADIAPLPTARRRPRDPITVIDAPESIHPSYDGLVARVMRNFTRVGVPKAERLETLNLEVLLTLEEARFGCVVPVDVPVYANLPLLGWVEGKRRVAIRIPPLARSGTVVEVGLAPLGIANLILRLHLFLGEE